MGAAHVDELLRHDQLVFKPDGKPFDPEAVAKFIEGLGYSFRDETDPATFVVSPDEESRDVFQARRRESPEDGFPHVLLIEAHPKEISVWPSVLEEVLPLSRRFVEWLLATYKCRVTDEQGRELTAPA